MMRYSTLAMAISAATLLLAGNTLVQAAPKVTVLDKTCKPASTFLAYTEFELSGEPLAEALGLDLDTLDPNRVDQPTVFDYAAGIESYEYSEEAMYALNYQSTMGVHLVNGPRNAKRGGKLKALGGRFREMAQAVGFPAEDMPLNMYPLSLPYQAGVPELAQAPDLAVINRDQVEALDAKGVEARQQVVFPAYHRNFKSLAWDASRFERVINPASVGGILLKEVMWSQDFLGGMHVTQSNEEVEATSSTMDQDGKHSLGVSAADGLNGMVLTELSIDKLLIMQNQLGFDGEKLGAVFDPAYDPAKKPIWFAHQVAVSENQSNGVNGIESLKVTDPRSTLEDTWLLLWAVSEFYGYTDQRSANTGKNPAFVAVFDGAPFEASPKVNIDDQADNDIAADDAFSLASNLANLLFRNLTALHFNRVEGTLVTDYHQGKQSQRVSTYDAAYALVALSIFQRARDALPVGYAAGGGELSLQTAQGKEALVMIRAQADFILKRLISSQGLVADGMTLGGEVSTRTSLDAQFAAIRGLGAAFVATGDTRYKQAARNIYLAVEKHQFDPALGTWAEHKGKPTLHSPYTAAAISGGLRTLMLHLKNEEGEHESALELATLTQRYAGWFKGVINGGMQLAEWLGDSGENRLKDAAVTDSDADGVPQITAAGGKFGTAMVMANQVRVE